MEFSETPLRRIRKGKRLSVPMLARLAGVTEKTVYNIEKGLRQGNSETLRKLAKALEVNVNELYEEPEPEEREMIWTGGIIRTGGQQEFIGKDNGKREAMVLVEEVLSAKFPKLNLSDKIKHELAEGCLDQLERTISLLISLQKER